MPNRYQPISITKSPSGKRYYVNNIYPDIPVSESDIYIIPTLGDRLDLLAYSYYKDTSLYWIIASANALPGDSLVPPLGQQLRIPVNVQDILAEYINTNTLR
jgi:hypothetical protein